MIINSEMENFMMAFEGDSSSSFIGTPVVTMVDGLLPELSEGNVRKCTSSWTPGWLVLRVFLCMRMMIFRKEDVF